LFLHCINLAWFRAILDKYPEKDIVFVAESRALLLIANVIAQENNDSKIYKCGFVKENIRFFCQIGISIFDGYKSLAFLFVKYIYYACVYKRCRTDKELKDISVIIDTFVFENSFDKLGRFVNRYFSELHELLCKTGISVGVLTIFYKISLKNVRHIFKKIYQSNTRFILLEDFLKPIDYLKTLAYPLKRLMCFEKVQDFLGINIQPLINEVNWVSINTPNTILSLLLSKWPQRIREDGINPRVYVNWSENQTFQKAIISGFHRNFLEMEVIGGKPFFPPLNHLNLFNTKSETAFGYAPDRIVTCGKELKNVFSIYDKEDHYHMGESFRYSYLRKLIYNKQNYSSNNSKHRIVSIILPQFIYICERVLVLSKKAMHSSISNGWNFRIKAHPSRTKRDVVALLKEYDMRHECIEETHEDMETLLPKSSAVITSASSVAVEAICLGIPVISIGMPISLDLNMLDSLPSSMWRLAFTDDDIDLGLNEWALCHPLTCEERREIGRKVIIDFFGEDTNNSLQIYLESLNNTKE
jgi:surface carbohydrate biosynthesis protein (TIGR04326 family)